MYIDNRYRDKIEYTDIRRQNGDKDGQNLLYNGEEFYRQGHDI